MASKAHVPDLSGKYIFARDAVDHAIAILGVELAKPRFTITKGESKLYLELRRDLPYAIHETNVQDTQILLNRNYKPLGNNSRTGENWVIYEDASNCHVKLTAGQIASLVSPGRVRSLFGDENPPWRGRREASAYFERLKALRSLI